MGNEQLHGIDIKFQRPLTDAVGPLSLPQALLSMGLCSLLCDIRGAGFSQGPRGDDWPVVFLNLSQGLLLWLFCLFQDSLFNGFTGTETPSVHPQVDSDAFRIHIVRSLPGKCTAILLTLCSD